MNQLNANANYSQIDALAPWGFATMNWFVRGVQGSVLKP